MREVDGGVFLNEPNIWLIAETMRKLFNESIAPDCGATLTKVTVVRKDTGEVVPPDRRTTQKVDSEVRERDSAVQRAANSNA